MRPIKVRLGEILVDKGLLSPEALTEALAKAKQTGKKLGRVLIDAKKIEENALVLALANQLGIDFLDLNNRPINTDFAQLLPETIARKFSCIVIDKKNTNQINHYVIAMSDPADVYVFDEIAKILPGEITVVASTEEGIYNAIDRVYRKNEEISEFAQELSKEFSDTNQDALDLSLISQTAGTEAPVVKLLQSIFEDSIARRASDIHIEPMDKKLLVRIRVDGTLHTLTESDFKTAAPLAQRLKLVAGLNISERRLPQDGRFNIKVHRHVIDVRIATTPTTFGEAVVMRLLNQNATHLDINQLGMPAETFQAFSSALLRPQGMILVTGPTGSGKTTTLYSALTTLNTPESKLITVEDPVEYKIQGVNQIQTHERIGLTFNVALRSILRQDPDVILVGEMRDSETVDAALRASMTGHMVLSTLHTNDAKSAAARLVDLGAEPFVIAQSLQLVLAQRLVRLNCQHCSVPYTPTDVDLAWSDKFSSHPDKQNAFYKIGKGCEQCINTGFLGRAAVYEHIAMDKTLVRALTKHTEDFYNLAEKILENRTIAYHANTLARQGLITINEARRVSYEI